MNARHLQRLGACFALVSLLAACGGGGSDDTPTAAATPAPSPAPAPAPTPAPAPVPVFFQTKTPYAPQQDAASYEAPPAGYSAVYTELVARHGSRGLSSLKYDLAVYNMWQRAAADGALTDLGAKLGPDVLKIMKANFLLGYNVPGISKPGYGNETQVGIREHQQLAVRLLGRLPAYWKSVGDMAASAPRQIVFVTSGVDRAVDSGNYFVSSLTGTQANLAPLVTKPAAPGPYPKSAPVAQPAGTNHFLLYFHKLLAATDAVTDTTDPLYKTYQDSQAFQAYANDPDQAAKQAAIVANPAAKAAGRVAMERLFTKAFVDKIDAGTLSFANTGTMTYTSDDGQFSSTLTGDGKTTIKSLADAGSLLYELYSIAPAMTAEANVDFSVYLPPDPAKYFAFVNDASDFYSKGPGISEKGDVTWRMAQILVDDFFNEVDLIAKGDLGHAAKLRFTHAEIMIPFATAMDLKTVRQQAPLATLYSYDNNTWRGEYVSPMASNMQWDIYRNAAGTLLVRMLFNEKETDFKAGCDAAKVAPASHYYDYTKLKACYGHVAL